MGKTVRPRISVGDLDQIRATAETQAAQACAISTARMAQKVAKFEKGDLVEASRKKGRVTKVVGMQVFVRFGRANPISCSAARLKNLSRPE